MIKLINPAPYGAKGLAYGSTDAKAGYSKSNPHKGQDFEWYYSDPVRSKMVVAPQSGYITTLIDNGAYNNGYGSTIIIQGDESESKLCHFDTISGMLRFGQYVEAGTFLGYMGNTGRAHGVHLHEELLIRGQNYNPNDYRVDTVDFIKSSGGIGMKFWTLWRRTLTGEIAVNTGGNTKVLTKAQYEKMRDIFFHLNKKDSSYATWPNLNSANNFFNLDEAGWAALFEIAPR